MESTVKIWLDDDGIARIDYGNCDEITVNVLMHINNNLKNLSNTPLPILSFGYKLRKIDYNAHEFMASMAFKSSRKAIAVIVGHQAKLLLNDIQQPAIELGIPFKLFTSETEAVTWLKQYI